VSAADDRKFFNSFSLTIGILVGVAVAIFFLSVSVAGRGRTDRLLEEEEYQRQVAERIAPPVKVAVAGQDNSALAIVPDASAKQATPVAAKPTTGTEVYQQVCMTCHGQGIAGAPRVGDAAVWAPRIAQGKDLLYGHVIQGYKGETGIMPPKGGRPDIPDDLIKAAVDHLVDEVAAAKQ